MRDCAPPPLARSLCFSSHRFCFDYFYHVKLKFLSVNLTPLCFLQIRYSKELKVLRKNNSKVTAFNTKVWWPKGDWNTSVPKNATSLLLSASPCALLNMTTQLSLSDSLWPLRSLMVLSASTLPWPSVPGRLPLCLLLDHSVGSPVTITAALPDL